MDENNNKINPRLEGFLDIIDSEDGKKLFDNILEVFSVLHDEKQRKYHRSLPFGDYFVDRWDRAERLGFGLGASIYDSAVVLGDVVVGENTWVGPNTILDGSGKLRIGRYCSISAGAQIYSHDSVEWATSGGEKSYQYEPTIIEDNCYIGPNVIVSCGITIGKGAVVGANSFVNKNIMPGQRVAGTPARVL